VLDIGCAFGYGTVALMGRGGPRRWIAGVERDPANVALAHRAYPWLPMVRADAKSLPFADQSVDAVVVLDVLEHLDDPASVLAEVSRVLRPRGALIVSVPHRGLLSACDSNNVYTALRRRFPSLAPLEPCEQSASDRHRHFMLEEARAILGPGFAVDRSACTGLGLAELMHLPLLVLLKGLLRWRGAYLALRHAYFAASIIEDLIPTGPLGYNLTLRARPAKDADVTTSYPADSLELPDWEL
jgi:SAM-dependent methyltransferase